MSLSVRIFSSAAAIAALMAMSAPPAMAGATPFALRTVKGGVLARGLTLWAVSVPFAWPAPDGFFRLSSVALEEGVT